MFTDEQMHHIVITYDGTAVRLAIDEADNVYAIELLPAVALFTKTFPNEVEQMRINRGNMVIFRLLYTICLFLPWTAWLAMAFRDGLTSRFRSIFLLALGLTLPPVVWELLLSLLIRSYAFQPVNAMIGVGVTAVSCCLFMLWQQQFLT